MSKLRKSVIKQKQRAQASASPMPRQLPTASDAALRDNYLYRSSIKAFLFAVVLFIAAVWITGNFWPIEEIRKTIGSQYDPLFTVMGGVLSFLLFLFLVLAWGNALEIRGNVIEWKHVLVCIVFVALVAAWGGMVSFAIYIFAAFGLLTYMWYAGK